MNVSARRIDGAVSRMVHEARWAPPALDFARRWARFLGRLRQRGDARARWVELHNKIAAYRLFQAEAVDPLDPYSRLFAAEGHAYRNARQDIPMPELPPALSPIAIHAGAGLWLAEQALRAIDAGESGIEVLAEFHAACRREARAGFAGIMKEALGLAARTLYPHLMETLNARLWAMDEELWERFWHGAGRGIYFAPSNVPPWRAAPWSGVEMCSREPPDETARRSARSGFGFALALVNLRRPEVLEAFVEHHGGEASDYLDGVQSALAVWSLSEPGHDVGQVPGLPSALCPLFRESLATEDDRRRPERLFAARPAVFEENSK